MFSLVKNKTILLGINFNQSKILVYIIVVFFLLSDYKLFAQTENDFGNAFIQNFNAKQSYLNTQVWGIAQSKNGLLYFGTNNGLVEYDGSTWRKINLGREMVVRSVAISDNGRIYIGSSSEFGFLEPDSVGNLKYKSLSAQLKEKKIGDTWKIFTKADSVFFIVRRESVYIYHPEFGLEKVIIPSEYTAIRGFQVGGKIFFSDTYKGFAYLKGNKFIPVKDAESLSKNSVYGMVEYGDKFLISTSKKGLFLLEIKNDKASYTQFESEINNFLVSKQVYCCSALSNGNYVFGTLTGGMVFMNHAGKLVRFINKHNGLTNDGIYFTFIDLHKNVWIASEQGISLIWADSPYTKFDKSNGLEGVITSIVRFKSLLFVATYNDVFYLKPNKDKKLFQTPSFIPISLKSIYNSSLLKLSFNNSRTNILLVAGLRSIIDIRDTNKVNIVKELYAGKSLVQSKKDSTNIYCAHPKGITRLKIRFSGDDYTIEDEGDIVGFDEDIISLCCDVNGNLWAGTEARGIFHIQVPENNDLMDFTITKLDTINGLPYSHGNKPYWIRNKLVISTRNGLYSLSNSSQQTNEASYFYFVPDRSMGLNFAKDSIYVYSIVEDNYKNIWFKTSHGLFQHNFKQNSLISAPFMCITEAGEEGSIFVENEDFAWLGGSNELFRFNQKANLKINYSYSAIFRKISIQNKVIYFGYDSKSSVEKKIIDSVVVLCINKPIPYNQNTLNFEFSATSYVVNDELLYRTYLEGYDKNWSEWNIKNDRYFTNLPEGKYKFHIVAKNIYGVTSNESVFEFEIQPPWYRTFYAYCFYIVCFVIMLYLAIKIQTTRLKRANQKLESIINERTAEIEQQKEEIKTQAEVLAHQSDNLILVNNELKHLSYVAQETDNSVVLLDKRGNFEWWNKGFSRLFHFRFEQLKDADFKIKQKKLRPDLLREIKNYSKEKGTVVYTSHEIFENGDEIWYQTTLNPVFDENGDIFRFVAIDSDITQIKKAEFEINQQKQEIRAQAEKLMITNRELERLSLVASETDNSIILIHSSGQIEWINAGFTRLFGYTLSDLENMLGNNLFISDLREGISVALEECKKTQNFYEYSTKTVSKTGKVIWFQTTITPIFDQNNNLVRFIAIDSDITKIKEAEEEILEQRNEIQRQRDQIARQNQDTIDSILYAKRIQEAMLPPEIFIEAVLPNYFIFNRPRDIVSGDFYWLAYKKEQTIFAVADCTGHGIPGAFMSMLGITLLKEIVNRMEIVRANEILNQLRERVISSMHQRGKEGEASDGMDIALCIFNPENYLMQFAGANNPLYLFHKKSDENTYDFREIEPDSMPIGIHYINNDSFTNQVVQLEPDDTVYIFTDGYADQFGGEMGRKFLTKNFKKLLISIQGLSLSDQRNILETEFDNWRGENDQVDDILVMGVQV